MKTTCNWIKEYCDSGLSAQEMADKLTVAGLEVEDLQPRGDDYILEAEVTSNRADMLSAIGIARDLSAITNAPLKYPVFNLQTSGEDVNKFASVELEAPELCPRYTARVITNVKIGPSPAWLADRIEAIGLRSVNNVVDITNFVLFECGQPLHAFDLDKLAGGKVIVRNARLGEKIVTIDGDEFELLPEMLVIADAEKPVALAGVMGGLDSEISENTTNVLLESAQFDCAQTRRTSRALGLSSDSSYRFERGVDPCNVEWASQRAAAMICEIAGGEVADGIIDIWPKPYEAPKAQMRISRFSKLIGIDISAERAAEILNSLGFEASIAQDGDIINTIVPPYRADVYREVDLIEEVARIHGFNRIPDETRIIIEAAPKGKSERITDHLRDILPGMGFYEALTNSFADERKTGLISPWTKSSPVEFNNTVRSEEKYLRLSLLPNMLDVKASNQAHGIFKTKIFEIGAVFLPRDSEPQPEERLCLTIMEEDGFSALKGVVEALIEECGVDHKIELRPADERFFENGRTAEMMLEGKCLAVLGELKSSIAEEMELRNPPALAEIDLDLLMSYTKLNRRLTPLPVYPASTRDIAVIVPEELIWARIEEVVADQAGEHLEAVEVFDVYRGRQIPADCKGIAFSLTFRAGDRTLTGEEVDAAVNRIVEALNEKYGAKLRKQ